MRGRRHDRERQLSRAYVTIAESHNQLGLTEPLDPSTRGFYDRPYQVPGAGRFAMALAAAIADPSVRQLPPIGAADQFMDSTDALGDLRYPRAVINAETSPLSDRDMSVLGVRGTRV